MNNNVVFRVLCADYTDQDVKNQITHVSNLNKKEKERKQGGNEKNGNSDTNKAKNNNNKKENK